MRDVLAGGQVNEETSDCTQSHSCEAGFRNYILRTVIADMPKAKDVEILEEFLDRRCTTEGELQEAIP